MGSQIDLDQGGTQRQWDVGFQGPSIGKVPVPLQNILSITQAGTYLIDPSTNFILVNVPSAVTITLPSASTPSYAGANSTQPGLFVKNGITVIDSGGNSGTHPITINVVGGQLIGGSASQLINAAFATFIFLPVPASNEYTMIVGNPGVPAQVVAWLNVKNFGAVGNGIADDTTAINSAIAAFNSAGAGVLYFPSGTYLVSSSLTTITARGMVLGDGSSPSSNGVVVNISMAATAISYTSNNTPLFTTASEYLEFRSIAMFCTAASDPVSGSNAVLITAAAGSIGADKVSFYACRFWTFYNTIEYRTGVNWFVDQCIFENWIHWGMRITNLITPDAGGWQLTNNVFVSNNATVTPAAAIHIEAGGGDHIVNTNIVTGGVPAHSLVNGIEVIPVGINTVDLLICNCSIENMTGFGIRLDMASGSWGNILVNNVEFAPGPGGGGIYCNPLGVQGFIFSNLTSSAASFITIVPNGTNPLDVSVFNTNVTQVAPEGGIWSGTFWRDGSGGVGGGQFFKFMFDGPLSHLAWLAPSGGNASLTCRAPDTSRSAHLRAYNNPTNDYVELFEDTATAATGGYVQATTQLTVASDLFVTSGGTDPISFRAGGNGPAAEVFQAIPAGLLKMTNAANFSANGAVATVLGSVGPTGSHTAVQKWLTVEDSGGAKFYIPCF